MMTHIRNVYAMGQKNYPATVQKAQALLTTWEVEKVSVHGSNEGLSYANVVNNDNSDVGTADDGNSQASGG